MAKRLPIGIQNFEKLISNNYVYIDKTESIHNLMNANGETFFLSRPRRFGKSLLLSTIQAVFEGKQQLFDGLFIYDKIEWKSNPVIMLDMSQNAENIETLKESLGVSLKRIAANNDIEISYNDPSIIFSELIHLLYKKSGFQVVVLVDEYDKPILDAIDDLERASEIRSFLQNFYTVIKSSGAYLQFVMLTGVSKISQTSIFSGLNNMKDISLNDEYSAICGYTQQELESNFGEDITALASKYEATYATMLAKIKHWYNGYSWNGDIFVYNPFSVLLLFNDKTFLAHWFNTGTPAFLLKLLNEKNDFSVLLQDEIEVNSDFANKQGLEKMDVVPLCFQTGYLTIKKADFRTGTLWLKVPNEEVRMALTETILADFTGQADYKVHLLAKNIKEAFAQGNVLEAINSLRILFSQVSYNTHLASESHYHAMFQLVMNLAGIDHQAESYSSKGRADSVLKFVDRVYVVECKYAKQKETIDTVLQEGMKQIKAMRYYKPFMGNGLKVHLISLVFSKGEIKYLEEVM